MIKLKLTDAIIKEVIDYKTIIEFQTLSYKPTKILVPANTKIAVLISTGILDKFESFDSAISYTNKKITIIFY